eukprot:gene27079-48586_t
MARYFDVSSRKTQAAQALLLQLQGQMRALELPRVDDTLRGAEMRAALWLLALFAVAVATALFAGNNQGTVTLYWPPYRVDLSLNLVLVLLALVFVTLHLALRALSGLLHIPVQAKRWRLLYKERAMHEALLDSLSNLVA